MKPIKNPLKITNNTSTDVTFTGTWCNRMVAKYKGGHSTDLADKPINAYMVHPASLTVNMSILKIKLWTSGLARMGIEKTIYAAQKKPAVEMWISVVQRKNTLKIPYRCNLWGKFYWKTLFVRKTMMLIN